MYSNKDRIQAVKLVIKLGTRLGGPTYSRIYGINQSKFYATPHGRPKQSIARSAALLLSSDDNIALDVGSSVLPPARELIKQADQVILLCDSSKFGKRSLVRACALKEIDVLITDSPPPRALAAALSAAWVKVQVTN